MVLTIKLLEKVAMPTQRLVATITMEGSSAEEAVTIVMCTV